MPVIFLNAGVFDFTFPQDAVSRLGKEIFDVVLSLNSISHISILDELVWKLGGSSSFASFS